MKRLILFLCLVPAIAIAATPVSKIYEKPDLPAPAAAARFYIYDPITNSDRNITWGQLSAWFAPAAPPWATISGKPSVFNPSVHSSSHQANGSDPLTLASNQVTGLSSVATSGSYADLANKPSIPSQATDIAYNNPTYTTVGSALDQLLYVAPGSPSVSGGGSYEIGQTITSVALTWSITLGNKTLTSQSIDNGIGSIDTALRAYTHSGQSITANRTYTVSITDGTTPRTGSTTVSFSRKRHWGASTIPLASITSANILALGAPSNEFSGSHTKTGLVYDCTGGRYPTYAFPITSGLLTAVKVGGLAFSDYSYRTISHTNASGSVTNYYVYQFNSIQSGASITVDWD